MLQLSLTLANDLYDLLSISGEPVAFLGAARKLLALKEAPAPLCREIMHTLVAEDGRFCWHSPEAIGLRDWQANDPDLRDVRFVVVDLETTGGRPGPAKITEIGAVRIEGLRVVSTYHSLVNPQRPIPPKIVELTGITADMVRSAPRIDELMPDLLRFFEGAVIVGHNTHFDLSFLNYELTRLNGRRLGDGALDTLKLARLLAPGLPNHRLSTVAGAMGSPVEDFHRALSDAAATAHVFLSLVGRLQERGINRLNEARAFADPLHKRDRFKLALTKDLPRAPGAYLFVDRQGEVLYVGKADRLRDRVRSYFVSVPNHSRRIRQALRRLHQIDWVETLTPLEAVVQEQELILHHRPPCNVLGRNPENYVYLKATGSEGLHLYASPSPSRRGAQVVMGPFRGRSRVRTSIELLQRCYPIRRCARPKPDACLYGQTGRCLAPCRGDKEIVQRHDEILRELLRWLQGDDLDQISAMPLPGSAAREKAELLARQGRFEDAAAIHQALEDMMTLRRSCIAVREAAKLNLAAIWPMLEPNGTPCVRVNVVWEGRLHQSITVNAATAAVELGILARSLSSPPSGALSPVVEKTQLDVMLAVRRWLLEHPQTVTVPYESVSPHEEMRAMDEWRQLLLAAVQQLLAPSRLGSA